MVAIKLLDGNYFLIQLVIENKEYHTGYFLKVKQDVYEAKEIQEEVFLKYRIIRLEQELKTVKEKLSFYIEHVNIFVNKVICGTDWELKYDFY